MCIEGMWVGVCECACEAIDLSSDPWEVCVQCACARACVCVDLSSDPGMFRGTEWYVYRGYVHVSVCVKA